MRGRKKNISPLVAARVRPVRQAPADCLHGDAAGRLRISRVGKSGDVPHISQAADENIGAREEVRRSATALHATEAALGKMSDLLGELEKTIDEACGVYRRPPGSASALQATIDSTLDAIDNVVNSVEFGGRKLLSERWPGTFEDAILREDSISCENGKAGFPDVDTRRFHGGPGGFLASLRSGAARSVACAALDEIRAVIQASMAELTQQREQLVTFLSTQVGPVIDALEVAGENVAAAENILDDADFALQVGRMTGADVLLNTSHRQRPVSSPTRSVRLSEFQADDPSHQD